MGEAYHLRNPMLLKAFAPKHARDEKGRRVFRSFVAGYENGLIDLRIKCSGRSRSHLQPVDPIEKLICVYGNNRSATRTVVNFLRHALKDDSIPETVNLGWFLEDDNNGRLDATDHSAQSTAAECSAAQPAA
jgi:hypothetical protein